MRILSETVSPALTANNTSLPAAMVAATTLTVLTIGFNYLTFHFRWMERLLHGKRAVLIDRGKVDDAVVRAERMTDQQLRQALHSEGLKSVDQVDKAYIEQSGDVTIIKKKS